METKENVEFTLLIKKYHADPKQKPSEADLILLKHLIDAYVYAEPQSEQEIPVYHQLTKFYNIFLESYFKENTQALESYIKLDESLTKNIPSEERHEKIHLTRHCPLQDIYPVLAELPATIINPMDTPLREECNDAYVKFIAAMGDFLSKDEQDILKPNTRLNTLYGVPHAKGLLALPFLNRVKQLYTAVEAKKGAELNLTKERDNFVKLFYHYKRAAAMRSLHLLYGTLDIDHIMRIPHVFYDNYQEDNLHHAYPKLFVRDILPHPLFEKIVKLQFQKLRMNNSLNTGRARMTVELLSKIYAEDPHCLFYGYTIHLKRLGKEPGFILTSKDGKHKLYVKHTDNMQAELFASKALSHLGIKTPEASLFRDEYDNEFYVTKDLSRQYSKGEHAPLKIKEFSTLEFMLDQTAPEVAFNMRRKGAPSPEEQQKSVEAFIAEFTCTPESRVSFAKLLIVSMALGITDFGTHGGNIGVIRTKKLGQEKSYIKFGIVDFAVDDRFEMDKSESDNPLKYIGDKIFGRGVYHSYGMIPICQKLYEKLRQEDLLAAAQQLIHPKVRNYSNEGLLLMSSPLTNNTIKAALKQAYEEMLTEIRTSFPTTSQEEFALKFKSKIQLQLVHMFRNLEAFATQLITQLSTTSQDTKEKKETLDIATSSPTYLPSESSKAIVPKETTTLVTSSSVTVPTRSAPPTGSST